MSSAERPPTPSTSGLRDASSPAAALRSEAAAEAPDPVLERWLAREGRISAAAEDEVPSPQLDAAIRAAARRAVGAGPQRRHRAWWQRGAVPLAAAAMVVLTVSVTTLVEREQRSDESGMQSMRPSPAQPALDAAAPDSVAGPHAQAQSGAAPRTADTLQRERADTAGAPRIDAARAAPGSGQVADLAAAAERGSAAAPSVAAPPATAPAAAPAPFATAGAPASPAATAAATAGAPVAASSAGSAAPPAAEAVSVPARTAPAPFANAARARESDIADAGSGAAAAAPAARARLAAPAPASAPIAAAPPGGDAAPAAATTAPVRSAAPSPAQVAPLRRPEAWLEEIAALRRAGREREADQALAEFRKAYPDHPVPASALSPR